MYALVRVCLRVRDLRLNDNADPEYGEERLCSQNVDEV